MGIYIAIFSDCTRPVNQPLCRAWLFLIKEFDGLPGGAFQSILSGHL